MKTKVKFGSNNEAPVGWEYVKMNSGIYRGETLDTYRLISTLGQVFHVSDNRIGTAPDSIWMGLSFIPVHETVTITLES